MKVTGQGKYLTSMNFSTRIKRNVKWVSLGNGNAKGWPPGRSRIIGHSNKVTGQLDKWGHGIKDGGKWVIKYKRLNMSKRKLRWLPWLEKSHERSTAEWGEKINKEKRKIAE